MSSTLSDAQAQASGVMSDLRSRLGGDVQFGLGEIRDYPELYGGSSDVPWKVDQSVTGDTGLVQSAIDGLDASGGGDNPEAYGRGLWEADVDPAVGWRRGARRLVVLIADEVPHDDDLNASLPPDLQQGSTWDTGQDPGPDGVVGTADDLDWEGTVLPKLSADGVRIAMVLVQDNTYLEDWRVWAKATGGDAIDGTTGDFSGAVAGIAESVAKAPDPPCPAGQARNAAGRCVSTTAVVYVSGLASTQRFADSESINVCPNGGTWQQLAADAMAFPAMANLQTFLAPMDKGSTVAPDCPGVAAATDPVMHLNSKKYANQDTNGAALVNFLAFLHRQYAITDVYLVGHSYGGIWSRSALTMLATGRRPVVRIAGVVTVGTPHTGSWGADLYDRLQIACALEVASPVRPACDARKIAQVAFGDAINGLTAASLAAWNPGQTNQASWGCVPIGTIEGDHQKNRIMGLGGGYYAPNDGIVGVSSAAAAGAGIQDPIDLGELDLVHVRIPLLLTGRVMTTDGEVRSKIIDFVTNPPFLGPNCSKPLSFSQNERTRTKRATAKARARRTRTFRATFVATPRGRGTSGALPRPATGSALILVNGAKAFCGTSILATTPLLALPQVLLADASSCRVHNVVIRTSGKRAGGVVVSNAPAGLIARTARGRMTLSLFGLRRGTVAVTIANRSGRLLGRLRLHPGKPAVLKLRAGTYRLQASAKRPAGALVLPVRV